MLELYSVSFTIYRVKEGKWNTRLLTILMVDTEYVMLEITYI